MPRRSHGERGKFDAKSFIESISDAAGKPNIAVLRQAIEALQYMLKISTDPALRAEIQAEFDALCGCCSDPFPDSCMSDAPVLWTRQ